MNYKSFVVVVCLFLVSLMGVSGYQLAPPQQVYDAQFDLCGFWGAPWDCYGTVEYFVSGCSIYCNLDSSGFVNVSDCLVDSDRSCYAFAQCMDAFVCNSFTDCVINNVGCPQYAQVNVTDCVSLNEDGAVYDLLNDVDATGFNPCFSVNVSSLTFDCHGYTISNGGTSFRYTGVGGADGVVFRNCNFVDTGAGVSFNSVVDNALFENLNFSGTTSGVVELNVGGSGQVFRNIALVGVDEDDGGWGLSVDSSTNVLFEDIRGVDSTNLIYLQDVADVNVSGVVADNCPFAILSEGGATGLRITDSVLGNTVIDGYYPIYLSSADNVFLSGVVNGDSGASYSNFGMDSGTTIDASSSGNTGWFPLGLTGDVVDLGDVVFYEGCGGVAGLKFYYGDNGVGVCPPDFIGGSMDTPIDSVVFNESEGGVLVSQDALSGSGGADTSGLARLWNSFVDFIVFWK